MGVKIIRLSDLLAPWHERASIGKWMADQIKIPERLGGNSEARCYERHSLTGIRIALCSIACASRARLDGANLDFTETVRMYLASFGKWDCGTGPGRGRRDGGGGGAVAGVRGFRGRGRARWGWSVR